MGTPDHDLRWTDLGASCYRRRGIPAALLGALCVELSFDRTWCRVYACAWSRS